MGIEDGKNIVTDDEMFDEFKSKLKEIEESGYDEDKIKYVIREIEGLKEHYIGELEELMDKDKIEKFEEDLEYYFGKFFDKFDNKSELFKYLENHTNKYFFNKKIFQLSHLRGRLYNDENPDEGSIDDIHEDLLNHLRLMLFLNYFESFPRYFEPIFFVNMIESEKYQDHTHGRARKWYDFLSMLTCELFEHETIQSELFDLRNNLAHSEFIVEDGKLCFPNDSDDSDTVPIDDKIELIKKFEKVVILISTEFDIRMLNLYYEIEQRNEALKLWKNYIDKYVDYWLQI